MSDPTTTRIPLFPHTVDGEVDRAGCAGGEEGAEERESARENRLLRVVFTK